MRGLQSDGIACERVTRGEVLAANAQGRISPVPGLSHPHGFGQPYRLAGKGLLYCRRGREYCLRARRGDARIVPATRSRLQHPASDGYVASLFERETLCLRLPLGSVTMTHAIDYWWSAGTTVPSFITRRFRGRWSGWLPCCGSRPTGVRRREPFSGASWTGSWVASPRSGRAERDSGSAISVRYVMADRPAGIRPTKPPRQGEAHPADSMRWDLPALHELRVGSLLSP
jgi:hypothetical protein